MKTRPVPTCFTICLPGSQKVNAGGASGVWLPGRELLRISASTTASRELSTQPGKTETLFVPKLAKRLRATFDELVQWMVQDASIDRQDRWGPRLS
jgi:hypothetical protein